MSDTTTDITDLLARFEQMLALLHSCVQEGVLTSREDALITDIYDSWVTMTGEHPQYVPARMDTGVEPKLLHTEPDMTAAELWTLFANSLDAKQYKAYDDMMSDPLLDDQQLFDWSKANLNEQQYILFVHAVAASQREN